MPGYPTTRTKPEDTANSALLTINATRNVLTIYVLLVFLGFPGTFSKVIGGSVASLLEYLSWGLQFMLVMLASGDDVWNIKLLNLQPGYRFIYLYITFISAESLLVTINRKTVITTLVHFVLTLMFALWLIEAYEPEELMEVFYGAQFLFVGVVLLCMVAFPNIAFYNYQGSRTLRGLFATKNEFGTELAFGILVQCILLRMYRAKGRPISILFLGMMVLQFFMILMTKNMGALLITIGFISYILYYGMSKSKTRLPLGLVFVVGSVGFLFFALTILQALSPLLESLGKDASLTGRVPLWERTITIMTESHTLTGYGIEMFWKTPAAVTYFHAGFDPNSWAATSSASTHNMLMELWCNTGLLGIAFFFFLFIRAGRGIRYLEENQYLFCSSYTVMFMVRGFTERQTNPSSSYYLLLFVMLGLMYQAEHRHKVESVRKARIYVSPEPEDTGQRLVPGAAFSTDGSELSAFQARFSNLAGTQKKDSARESPQDEWLEPEEKQKTLDDLFRELDGDDF